MQRYWLVMAGFVLLFYAARAVVAGDGADNGAFPRCARCNLILLNIDLLRTDHVGLLQPGVELTPAIDRFFQKGLILQDVSSSSGATYISATATATGTEAMFNQHDIWKINKPGGGSWRVPWIVEQEGSLLIDRMPTIAQTLSANGYHTIAVNDWIHSGERVNLDRGFSEYVQLPLFGSLFSAQVEKVKALLERRNKDPLFLYFHSNALHFKLYFPPDWVHRNSSFAEHLRKYGTPANGAMVIDTWEAGMEQQVIWAAYAEQVRYIDQVLESLFRLLEREEWARTIVVFYANHGTDVDEKGRLGVGLPYRSYLHVPLLIRYPHWREQTRIDEMTSLVDLAPTLYDLLEIEPLRPLTTHSMVPLLESGSYPREYSFSRDIQFASVRNKEWKLVVAGGLYQSLYHLPSDRGQQRDLYRPGSPIARNLRAELARERMRQRAYAARLKKLMNNNKLE